MASKKRVVKDPVISNGKRLKTDDRSGSANNVKTEPHSPEGPSCTLNECEEQLEELKSLNPPPEVMDSIEQIKEDYSCDLEDKIPHLNEHLSALIKLFTSKSFEGATQQDTQESFCYSNVMDIDPDPGYGPSCTQTNDPEKQLEELKSLNAPPEVMESLVQIKEDYSCDLKDKMPHLNEHLSALIKLFRSASNEGPAEQDTQESFCYSNIMEIDPYSLDWASHTAVNEPEVFQKQLEELKSLNPPPEVMQSVEQIKEDYSCDLKNKMPHLNEHLSALIKLLTSKSNEEPAEQDTQELSNSNNVEPDPQSPDGPSCTTLNECKRQLEELKNLNPPPEVMESVEQMLDGYSCHLRALIQLLSTKSEEDTESQPEHDKKPQLKAHVIVSAKAFEADDQILKQLEEHDVELTRTETPEDCQVVLLFCVINTRVGADVRAAMKKIPDAAAEKPVFLVLMFHTRKGDYAADAQQWSSKYKNIQFQTEVLFHRSEHGLLQCERNDNAIERLVEECGKTI